MGNSQDCSNSFIEKNYILNYIETILNKMPKEKVVKFCQGE